MGVRGLDPITQERAWIARWEALVLAGPSRRERVRFFCVGGVGLWVPTEGRISVMTKIKPELLLEV